MQKRRLDEGTLFLLGGNDLRFLIEAPLRIRIQQVRIESFAHENDLHAALRNKADQYAPCCLLTNASSIEGEVFAWVMRHRSRWPLLPIVILGGAQAGNSLDQFLPQLIESVTLIKYPYTQQVVVDALQNAVWWSKNLCQLMERARRFQNLSQRELAIVSMATDGVPNKTMARRLEVSIKTVEKNRRVAYEKLKISCAAEMAALVTFRRYFCRFAQNENALSPVPVSIESSIEVRSSPHSSC